MTKKPSNRSDARPLSRQWWLGAGATFFWVAIVTILVWTYADMEFTKTAKVSVTLVLNVGRSENLVLLSKPQTKVVFEVRGNRRELDVFLGKHNNTVVSYDVSEIGPGRNQRLRVNEILNSKLNLEKLGLQIRSANPTDISGIHIDQRKSHKVPVEFDFTGAELTKVPQQDINVWATDSQWEKIEAELARKQTRAVLRTVKTDLKNKDKGKPIKVTVDDCQH